MYLRVHEIGTHSILGSLAIASAAAALSISAEARRPIRIADAGRMDRRAQPPGVRPGFRGDASSRVAAFPRNG